MTGIGPGDLVVMDIATLSWSAENYRYFLCIVDVFTRYVEAVPLKDQKAVSLVRESRIDGSTGATGYRRGF